MTAREPGVADLRDQLQDALGGAYVFERELGGGGMSRVFVARERELDRRVVIKVLPPELAQGVNLERFRRETQLAASLQHPHIVPLLTAGSEAGLLYYVMPYVEGESLRARLDREGRLPVAEAVRLLREVADALASAHRRGVVHRDIKPGNVLLLDGHAMVTDFGVAKSLGAKAPATSDLTTAGIAIGTPTYMAPEQAAADPQVDHRADIYALGVMGYEMLAGRPPFQGMSPAATLAAHLATPPEPLARWRPDIPPELAEAVDRCLAKQPDARWQSADDLRRRLEGLATPGDGTAAQWATGGHGLDATIRRLGVPTALVGYVLGSVAVTWVLKRAIMLVGLPDWVFPAGVSLLVIGLAILILAALGQIPWLTRRGAVVGGLAAFGLLGLSAASYLGLRAAGVGPMASLVSAGKLGLRDRVLVADFENRTGDALLGDVVTEAFRTDLTQSPVVKVVQPGVVDEVLARMQRPAGTRLDATLAREVAVREGIKALVTGDITGVGSQLVLSARLVAAGTGDVLAAFRETAADSSHVIDAIDRLSKQMRERMGESLRTIRSDGPLADVTTSSLDALRKYTQAVRAADREGDYAKAIPLLEEAIRSDSTFAMAYRKLGIVLSNERGDPRRAIQALTRAYELRTRLPERERLLAEATYYMRATNQADSARAVYERLLTIDPDNMVALNNLGVLMMDRQDWLRAEQLFQRILELDSGSVNRYATLAEVQLNRGDTVRARATLGELGRRFPGDARVTLLAAGMSASRLDFDAAEATLRGARAGAAKGSRMDARELAGMLAQLALVRGRLAEYESLRAEQRAAMPAAQQVPPLREALGRAWVDYWVRRRPEDALRRVEQALAATPLEGMDVLQRPYDDLIALYARVGRLDRARALDAERERARAALAPELRSFLGPVDGAYYVARGDLAAAAGRVKEAEEAYRLAMAADAKGVLNGLPELALLYEQASRPDSARAAYERYLDTPSLWRAGLDAFHLAMVYERLGGLYEQSGERGRAAEMYGRLAALYRGADPELRPILQRARDGLARVTAEPAAG